MEGLGRRNGAFGPIVETTIPMNDRVCWFGDGVSRASDFHLRFYGRFADLHKLHALHVRLSRSCAQGQWPYGENRIGRHCEGMQRSQGSRVVSLDSSRPGAGVGQFMRFFSMEGPCRARVREAAFPCTLHFRDSRSTILNFAFDAVASDHWISAFLSWPLLPTTSIPRRVSGCAATSLRASLLDRCWCAAGCLWRAARGDTR